MSATAITPQSFIDAIQVALPILNEKAMPTDLFETLARVLSGEHHVLDRERFNIVLSSFHVAPCKKEFFRYYFNRKITTTEEFISGMHQFIKDALWHFGDVWHGYHVLNRIENIDQFIEDQEFDVDELHQRLDWTVIENIAPSERGYLGYVSGARPYREKDLIGTGEMILDELNKNSDKYRDLSPDEVSSLLVKKFTQEQCDKIKKFEQEEKFRDLELFDVAELITNRDKLIKLRTEIEQTIRRVEELKKIGRQNQLQFLRNVEMIDVYVATSMRDDKEYLEMADFVNRTFSDEVLEDLHLRYFDPTLCYCDSRIDKGIIECLLVRCAKVTVYCAQEGDTFGKDSELAATLCQGKPVIVYVPISDDPEEAKALDKRADVFREFHPLSLQVGLYDGVARGVIVVRSAKECASTLYRLLTNALQVEISPEEHGIVLREKETNSVVRVMTGWQQLASAFWHNFGLSEEAKSGRPR